MTAQRRHGDLTPKQQRFVQEYLVDLNATQAAVRAGYSRRNADKIGPELLGKTRVAAAIVEGQSRLAAHLEMSARDVLHQAAVIARSDIRRLLDDQGRLLDPDKLPADVALAVASMEIVERRTGPRGQVERVRRIRFWDKIAALTLLAKHHRLLTDRSEVELKGGVKVLTTEDAAKMSDAELAAAAKRLADETAALAAELAAAAPDRTGSEERA